jgi:hypothetical protein
MEYAINGGSEVHKEVLPLYVSLVPSEGWDIYLTG